MELQECNWAVKSSVGKVLQGENPGTVADNDHGTWYREMFAPQYPSRRR